MSKEKTSSIINLKQKPKSDMIAQNALSLGTKYLNNQYSLLLMFQVNRVYMEYNIVCYQNSTLFSISFDKEIAMVDHENNPIIQVNDFLVLRCVCYNKRY